MLEREIEKILKDEVKRLGGRAYKWVSPGNSGVPDRIVIFPGQAPIFTELKTASGRLTALQELQLKRLTDLGQRVYVIYGIDGLIQFFQDLGFGDVSKELKRRFK